MDSTPLIEYGRTQSAGGSGYPYAFGWVWATLSERQQKAILKEVARLMAEEEAKKQLAKKQPCLTAGFVFWI